MGEKPSRNKAIVSFTPRPCRRSTAMKMTEPIGRAMKASEKTAKEYRVAVRGSAKGKNTLGNTTTEAIAKTKKSKYSAARPMMTPRAISLGATLWSVDAKRASRSSGVEEDGAP